MKMEEEEEEEDGGEGGYLTAHRLPACYSSEHSMQPLQWTDTEVATKSTELSRKA